MEIRQYGEGADKKPAGGGGILWLRSIGIDVPITEHRWTLPNDIDEIVGYDKWVIRLLGGYKIKGYSPANAAMDIREKVNVK